MIYSDEFVSALKRQDFAAIRQVPKSDLHNHFVLGGSREYIFEKTGVHIPGLEETLGSMQEMHDWCRLHVDGPLAKSGAPAPPARPRFDSSHLHRILLEAAFYQAKEDGVTLLEVGEDVWANREYYDGDVSWLIDTFYEVRDRIAPGVELRLQIGISRHCPISLLEKWLEPFWGRREFYSIDLSGDESAQPIENFVPIYRKARERFAM